MEIWFYHLTRQTLEAALPTLVERALARGWRSVIQAQDEERIAAVDDLLWTYSDAGFIAHGRARDGDAAMQPVFLTTSEETPNGAQARFFIDGAPITPFLATDGASAYERLIVLFDGADAQRLAAARAQWKDLKDRGQTLSYWRQSEAGGWERVA